MSCMTGLCECGCGRTTRTWPSSSPKHGRVKGAHRRFVVGHQGRRSPVDYVVDKHGCWLWQLGTSRGYGMAWNGRKKVLAHRWYYEQAKGAIPIGLTLDHLCRV